MAKKLTVSDDITKTFGAAFEAFLGEFKDAVTVGDRHGAALAASKLSQLCLTGFELFKAGCDAITEGEGEKVACHEAAIVVRNMMEKHLERWYRHGTEPKPN